jgi:hypothetical protein
MKKINFPNKLSLIKFIATHPKEASFIAVGALMITVGGQQLKAQELLGLKPFLLNPVTNANGLSVHNRTYSFDNLNTPFEQNALWSTMEARYGGNIGGKLDSKDMTTRNTRYNIGVEVGSNNLQINKKLVSDKLYEQIHMVLVLSKVFNTPLNVKLGYSQKFNEWKFQDMTFAANVNAGKSTTGGSIVIKDGKIINYDGLQEVKFGNIYSATFRMRGNPSKTILDSYFQLIGCVELNKNKSFKFTPYVGISSTKDRIKKFDLDYNFSVIFKPKGKFSAYAEVGFNKSGKWTWLSKLSYQLTSPKAKDIQKDLLKQELNKEQINKQKSIKAAQEKTKEASKNAFKPFRTRSNPRPR